VLVKNVRVQRNPVSVDHRQSGRLLFDHCALLLAIAPRHYYYHYFYHYYYHTASNCHAQH
jgi:hypothetical protein